MASGTSMASPQVAGMVALVQQYLREQGIEVAGMTSRALTQSLLMSTATALRDRASGNYYPVQGSLGGYSSYNSYTGAGYQLRCVREQTTAMPKGRLPTGPVPMSSGSSYIT